MRRAATAGWLALALAAGCEQPRTELVVRVDSEVAWGPERAVQSVQLTVRRGGPTGALRSSRVTVLGTGSGRQPLPLYVGLIEGDGDTNTPVWIEALGCATPNGCEAATAVVAQRAVVRFVRGQTQEVPLLLASACVDVRCASNQRCIVTSGMCEEATRAQDTVRPFVGTDASVVMLTDGGAPDVPTVDVTGSDAASAVDGDATDADATDADVTDADVTDAEAFDIVIPSDMTPPDDVVTPIDMATPIDVGTPIDVVMPVDVPSPIDVGTPPTDVGTPIDMPSPMDVVPGDRGNPPDVGAVEGGAPPSNDRRASARAIDMSMPSQTLTADTTNAVNDTTNAACTCTSGRDVFFGFNLSAPEVVYADTIGTAWNTSLFIQNTLGTNVASAGTEGGRVCDDDMGLCGGASAGRASQVVARLPAGPYYLVLSGCEAGPATIRFQHTAAGNGPSVQIAPSATPTTLSGTTSGFGTSTNVACMCTTAAENSYWWVACPDAAAATFHATSCGTTTAFDNALDQRSPGRTTGAGPAVCNNDTPLQCGRQPTITSSIPAGPGLHTLLVDGCYTGAYQVRVGLGSCGAGQTYCGACVDTQNDASHCGGCSRQCVTGTICRRAVCVSPPDNDTRAGATRLTLSSNSLTLTADTTNASNEGASSACSCSSGNDVFFRFSLGTPSIVYADTIGTTWDTSLFFQNDSGVTIASSGLTDGLACNDNGGLAGCALPAGPSQVMAYLGGGPHYLVLSGCGAGPATVHLRFLPVGNGPATPLAAGAAQRLSGTTSGTGRIARSCCAGGPENTYYWYTCGDFPGGAFSASFCSTGADASYDTSLAQLSTTSEGSVDTCNDDSCSYAARVNTFIPAGAGIHTLYVDGCRNAATGNLASGTYTVVVTRP